MGDTIHPKPENVRAAEVLKNQRLIRQLADEPLKIV